MVRERDPRTRRRPAASVREASLRTAGTGSGVRKVSSSVALIRPPKIVTATGCRISLPGVAASISSGTSATPADSAVISTGVSRSSAAAHDEVAAERHAFVQRQIDVVADLQDAVARRDAGQRDEADHAGDRERLAGDPERRDRADQRERHAAHDDQRQQPPSGSGCRGSRRSGRATPATACRWCGSPPPAPGTCLRGCVKIAFRQLGRAPARRGSARRSAPCRRVPSVLASTTMRRRPFSRRIWFGPVGLLDVGDLPRRNPAARRFDQEIAEPLRGAQPVRQPHHHVEAAVAVDDARDHAPVGEPAELLDDGRRLHAVERGAAVIDADFELRDAAPAFRPAGRQGPGSSQAAAAGLRPGARSVSRSSPKILTAISARTPDSMWSSRCEIGWPTLTDDAAARRAARRISATISALARADGLRSTSISEECTPSACSSSSARPVRRPTDFTSGTSRMSRSAIRPTRLRFRKRDAGIEQHVDGEGAFVEGRQERARQQEGQRPARRDRRAPIAADQSSCVAKGALEQRRGASA